MKTNSMRYIFTILAALSIAAMSGCSMLKPASKEDATKKILTNLFDDCNGGKNDAVATELWDIMPEKERAKFKSGKIDYADEDGKNQVDRVCRNVTKDVTKDYEFGKSQATDSMVTWEVFPKGKSEGKLFKFKLLADNKYELSDVDDAKK